MGIDAVTGGVGDLSGHLIEQADFGIDDFFTSGTDQMRMRSGLVAVIAVASISETDLEDFTDLLEQVHCFINRSQTGGGEIHLDFLIDFLNSRVILALKKCLEDRYSLRCDAEIALAQLGQNFIQSGLKRIHFAFPVRRTLMRTIVNR